MRSPRRILILGAGIAGLSAAWHLEKEDVPCLILEKEDEIGGLCRSKNVNGFVFDYSGHLLHFKTPYVFDLARKLLKGRLVKHERSAWVSVCGRYTRYPFQANLYGLPAKVIQECLEGFVRAQKKRHEPFRKRPENFFQWTRQTFGSGMARYFMDPYNAKFWTVPPKEMTCEWLEGMVPVPSLEQVRQGARRNSTDQLGYNVHFWYPRSGGIEQLPQAFAGSLQSLRTGSGVFRIHLGRKEIETFAGRKEKFDRLISTVPLPELASMIPDLPQTVQNAFDRLRWNSIFNLNLGTRFSEASAGWHWIYFPQKEKSFFRVGFPHHFSSHVAPPGKGSLYAEVSYSKRKPIDKQKILHRITRDLAKTGFLSSGNRVLAEDINDIEYGYPIYDHDHVRAKSVIFDFLRSKDIFPCGRYGAWKYMSMEDAILDGRQVAQKLLQG